MPTTYFVTRHAGAKEWAARKGIAAKIVEHVDLAAVGRGDVVISSLPAHFVADLIERGARYVHLAMEVPEEDRGRNLSADEMDRYGARLVEMTAAAIGPYRPGQ